jgi:hypothetical protein
MRAALRPLIFCRSRNPLASYPVTEDHHSTTILHLTTTIQPHFLHVFSSNYRRFGPESACETGLQTEVNRGNAEDSPQLTTKTEDWFYPQRNGLATPS